MKISLIQSKHNKLYDFLNNLTPAISDRSYLSDDMVNNVLELCENAENGGIIVTTEAVNYPGDLKCEKEIIYRCVKSHESECVEKFSDVAKKHKAFTVAGLYRTGKDNIYNSAYIFTPDGNILDVYDKIHLAGDENSILTKGERNVVFDTPWGRIGVLICYDMQFSKSTQKLKEMGADVVVCPTWGWEKEYVLKRAVETNIPMVGAMALPHLPQMASERNPSGVIFPNGKIIETGREKPTVFDIELQNILAIKS